jgi:hypothetical protein
MTLAEFRYEQPGVTASAGRVYFDGVDISHNVTGFKLDVQVGRVPTLTLDILAGAIRTDGTVVPLLAPETVEMLERLGWTPPNDKVEP